MSVRSRIAERPVAKAFAGDAPAAMTEAMESVSRMGPQDPFSPGEPIRPFYGYDRTLRSREVITGENINSRPRSHERVSFETLRGLIQSYDVARICIRHRIASLRSLDWRLIAADHYDGDVTEAVALGRAALHRPDGKTLFKPWLAKYLRDVLSYDAGTLAKMRNRAGRAVGLKVVSGITIAPLIDYWGDSPDPPAPAYVQYSNGLPFNWLTRDDIIYEPYDPQPDSIYGMAPLEDILLNANTDIRFQLFFLQTFTDGNIPAAFASAPESWSPQQIEQFQELWDAFMLGDQSRKSQIRWIPPGSKFAWSNEKEFKDEFSLFLMRKTCAAYSVVPADLGFTESVNRSSGESQADVQHRVGDLPLAHHVQDILTAFLQDDLGLPVKFTFDLGEEQDDRVAQAQADDIYIKDGVVGSSEIREMRYGRSDPAPIPRYIYTERGGPIPVQSLLSVAGQIDPATGLPEPGAPLSHEVFGGTEGVLPNPPIKVMSLAEQEYGPSAMPPAPPPQPKMTPADEGLPATPVAKEGEAAPSAGITSKTGIYGDPLLRGEDDDETRPRIVPGDVRVAVSPEQAVAKEMAAFRRFAKARRKAGQWRDFTFDAVAAGEAARLNADGRASVAKAAVPGLTSRSGMISLDIPDGVIEPVPGGLDDFHVTVCYLGGDVDDEAWGAACERARQAASAASGPLTVTLSGIGSFPPSGSSDGKVPAFIPAGVPGGDRLRAAVADLSASEHSGWTPHVTLAYLDEGEPLPAPCPEVQVTVTHLSVHRGDQVVRYPLGGGCCGAGCCADGCCDGSEGCTCGPAGEVAKAADARPKRPDWPGWKLDHATVAHWAPQVASAVTGALPAKVLRRIAGEYLGSHPEQKGDAPGKKDRNDAAAAWLRSQEIDGALPVHSFGPGIVTDAYLIGAVSAAAAVTGQPADTGGWQPGDSDAARDTVEALGAGAALASVLASGSSDALDAIAGGIMAALARILAGADGDADPDGLAAEMGDALAGDDLASSLIFTQITIVTGQAAQDYYLENTVSRGRWVTADDSRVCPACLANAGAGLVKMGDPYPSGDVMPPAHPGGCRCAVVPDWA